MFLGARLRIAAALAAMTSLFDIQNPPRFGRSRAHLEPSRSPPDPLAGTLGSAPRLSPRSWSWETPRQEGELARRRRQIERGQLTMSNGLVPGDGLRYLGHGWVASLPSAQYVFRIGESRRTSIAAGLAWARASL